MIKKTALTLLVTICLFNIVSSYGISSAYWNERPLIMSPGESKTIEIYLQNMVGNEDIELEGNLLSGNEFAVLIDGPIYSVPFGKKDVIVKMKINIPEQARENDVFTIVTSFKKVSTGDHQMLELEEAVSNSLPVLIQDIRQSPDERNNIYSKVIFFVILSLIFVVIAIIIIVLIVTIRKGNPKV